MMQVMQLKIRELPPLSIDNAIATGFPKVKASKAYLNDAIATGGEGKQSISQ